MCERCCHNGTNDSVMIEAGWKNEKLFFLSAGKENKSSPIREGSPSVGGIASLTRPGVAVSNGNGSSAAAMTTADVKPA